jgi:dTDP-4-dehydrorhamnose reductase
MNLLLFGANGQLGKAFRELASSEAFPLGWTLQALSSKDGDLSSDSALRSALEGARPDVVINAAAYTAVDLAEKEQERCEAINARAPAVMARYCAERKIPLVHFSTDYVYAGVGSAERTEQEPHAPLSFYGASKARGDEAVMASGCDHLIFRTSWVFSHTGKNFVLTMLRLGSERSELRIVDDQIGSPTYAPDLAEYSLHALMRALESKLEGKGFPSGVYHLCNSGQTSWAGFARAILPNTRVVGIPSSEYPTPARRPLNSRLSLQKFIHTFGLTPRPWQEALEACLKKVKENHG